MKMQGFTLIEILIALSIFCVGMGMAASLIPAGIIANQHSQKDLVGTMICQNALAIARVRLKHSNNPPQPTDSNLFVDVTQEIKRIAPDDLHYPIGPNDQSGWFLLCRRIYSGGIYQLVAVSYTRKTKNGAVFLYRKTNGIADYESKTIRFSDKNFLQIGSPVIFESNGFFARILKIDIDPQTGDFLVRLDNPPKTAGFDIQNSNTWIMDVNVWVVYEEGGVQSPGLTALSTIAVLDRIIPTD